MIPQYSVAMKIAFPSLEGATSCARDTLKCGVNIGRCELLDDKMVQIINQMNTSVNWNQKNTLLYEITGISDASVMEQVNVVKDIARTNGASDDSVDIMKGKSECETLWRYRKECLWSAMAAFPDKEPIITDVAVPLTQLPAMMRKTRELLDSTTSKFPSPIIAHAGMFRSFCLSIDCRLMMIPSIRYLTLEYTHR